MKPFHLHAVSGLVATAAANGVLFAWHNDSASATQYIQRVRAKLSVQAPPSVTAQEAAISMHRAVFTTDFTDGQNLSDPATAANYAVRHRNLDITKIRLANYIPVSSLASGNVRIASTAALSGATPTVDAHSWQYGVTKALPVATVVAIPDAVLTWENPIPCKDFEEIRMGSMPLTEDQGFVITMPVAIANSLVIRLSVEVEWVE